MFAPVKIIPFPPQKSRAEGVREGRFFLLSDKKFFPFSSPARPAVFGRTPVRGNMYFVMIFKYVIDFLRKKTVFFLL